MHKHVFLISLSIVFLFIAFGNLARQPDRISNLLARIFPSPTPEIMDIKGIGVIGDSLSDEYQADDARGYEYQPTTLNWIEQLVKSRNLNFGLWGTWGDVRRTGFSYNWSRTGATTTAALLNGQHSGIAELVKDKAVNIVIIFIGGNDFFPFNDRYTAIYNGTLTGKALQEELDVSITNIKIIIDTIEKAGKVKILLVTIPDWNMSAAVQLANQDPSGRSRVSSAVEAVNLKLVEMAQKKSITIVDSNAFYHSQLADAPLGSIRIGAQDISLYIPGDEPHHAFLSDTIHPGSALNGLFANYIIDRMNQELHTGIQPLTIEEIVKNAGLF